MDDETEGRVWCHTCDGDGHVPDPKAAIIDCVPQLVIASRVCRWCKGTGRRHSLHPPA
ncbi:hypothetical protein [Saccharomonospora sp.]|uniref:hypothetical protein n=1 Tax=Saccharomonospora sp. TaxID=33913 RepID=UPI0026108BAA|nr:hypothetical protein [Saccharomonospora sp.]